MYQMQDITNINTGEKVTNQVGSMEKEVPIGTIPICVRSKYCNLNLKKKINNDECEYDPGGYYIVNGSEKVIVSLERMCDNKAFVFKKGQWKFYLYCSVN